VKGELLSTLKIVIAWSGRRNVCTLISDALEDLAGADEVRKLSEEAYVVHTALTSAELRDRLRAVIREGEGVFAAEFEVWSGHGEALDSRWLLARGH
jgi:hypothetical protein